MLYHLLALGQTEFNYCGALEEACYICGGATGTVTFASPLLQNLEGDGVVLKN